eukprot:c17858_g1_i1.p1 GENE.c17858_g1_i1~~c17858_g1_i1.p1  ORF type:complete len:1232 (+),score=216.08 c17858_g1_i1:45-3740(+)
MQPSFRGQRDDNEPPQDALANQQDQGNDDSRYGVPLSELVQTITLLRWLVIDDEHLGSLTTGDVCRQFIKPMTFQNQSSVRHLRADGRNRTQSFSFVSRSMARFKTLLRNCCNEPAPKRFVFVSHCWQDSFVDLVQTLQNHFQGMGDGDVIVWLDVLTFNQHCNPPFTVLEKCFRNTIHAASSTVMVIKPSSPTPLKRAWCLYELTATAQARVRFEIAVPQGENSAIQNQWLDDVRAKHNLEESKAYKVSDEEAIHHLANSQYERLNAMVWRPICDWMLRKAESELISVQQSQTSNQKEKIEAMQTYAHVCYQLYKFNDARVFYMACEETASKLGLEASLIKAISGVAKTLCAQGKYDQAEECYSRCFEQSVQYYGGDAPITIELMSDRGVVCHARGRYADAEKLFMECLDRTEDPETRIACKTNLASLWCSRGKYSEARHLFIECVDELTRTKGPADLQTLTAKSKLASVYDCEGNFDVALRLHEECFSTRKTVLGDEHPSTIDSLSQIAALQQARGDYKLAESQYRTCLTHLKAIDDDHPDKLTLMGRIAACCKNRGSLRTAETNYTICLESMRAKLGEDHPQTLSLTSEVAELQRLKGVPDEGMALSCVAQQRQLLGDDHPDTLASTINLATLYYSMERMEEAEELFRRCLELVKFNENHPTTLKLMSHLAMVCCSQGRFNEAQQLFEDCLGRCLEVLTAKHPDTQMVMHNLAKLYSAQEQYDKAGPLFVKCLDARMLLYGPDHPDTLSTMHELGDLHQSARRLSDAEKVFVPCLEKRKLKLGLDHPHTLATIYKLAECYRKQSQWAKSQEFYEMYYARHQRLKPSPESDSNEIALLCNLGFVHLKQGHFDEAREYWSNWLNITLQRFGEDDRRTFHAMKSLSDFLKQLGRYAEARPLYEKRWEVQKRKLGENKKPTLQEMYELAVVCRLQGDYKTAKNLCSECQRGLIGEDDDDTAILSAKSYLEKGECSLLQNPLQPSLEDFISALKIFQRTLGPAHRDTLETQIRLADVHFQLEHYDDAEQMYMAVMGCIDRTEDTSMPLKAMHQLACTSRIRGKYRQGLEHCKKCWDLRAKKFGKHHHDTLASMHELARLYRVTEDYDRAELHYKNCLAGRKQLLGEDNSDTLASLSELALTLFLKREYDQASAAYETYMAQCRRLFGDQHPSTLRAIDSLVEVYTKQSKYKEAELLLTERFEALRAARGGSDSETLKARNKLLKFKEQHAKKN